MIEPGQIFQMREKCKKCGNPDGFYELQNGQRVVRCKSCNKACYNAPKNEIGLSSDPITSRKNLKDTQKVRIFERDGFRCMICGKAPATEPDIILHVSHIISVKQADLLEKKYNVSAADYVNKDINLFTCCSECNLGQGSASMIPSVAVFIAAFISGKQSPCPAARS
jgi:ribosomal protein S14